MAITDTDRARAYRARMKAAGTPAKGGRSGISTRDKLRAADWPHECVYIDGEAFEEGGVSSYSLLQTLDPATGIVHTTSSVGEGRLHSEQCFEHLFLPTRATTFGYGLGYDFSNWFADLPLEGVQRLYRTGTLAWRRFRLFFVPGKFLKVIDRSRPEGDRQRLVYDLLPFYQQPFAAALTGARLEVPAIITEGKAMRGAFTTDKQAFVSDYNIAELRAMQNLHTSLADILRAGDCKIRSWYGPGSMARHYAKRHGVEVADGEKQAFLAKRRRVLSIPFGDDAAWHSRWDDPHAAAVDAFYGGRFEMSIHGVVDACWEYDLASAYPWAFTQGMPCFACGGSWLTYADNWQDADLSALDDLSPWTLLEVDWKPRGNRKPMWGPFPYRMKRNLAWTREGRGIYHLCEVRAALEWLRTDYSYTIRRVVSWQPDCVHDPWSWVGSMAAERVAIKHTDPGKAQCLKLALNSLYGITADKSGVDNGRVPGYHNPYWAGLITARTRARLLQAASVGGEDICYLATDGVHSRRPLDLPVGPSLGDWEPPKRAGIACVFLAPGTYKYNDAERGKSRGISLGTFGERYEDWVATWESTRDAGGFDVPRRQFISVREAANRTLKRPPDDYEALKNTWTDSPKRCSYDLNPRRAARPDGRWIAPSAHLWEQGARTLHLLGVDDATVAEEEASYYQPDYAADWLEEHGR